MNARLTGTGVLALAGVVGGVLLLVALRRKAGAVADAINPASADNLAYAGVNRAGASISGNPAWTLGGWLFDATHDQAGQLVVPGGQWFSDELRRIFGNGK